MITGKQIRAARALAEWSAAELAEQAGLTRDGIARIESGDVTPRTGSIVDITTAFAQIGIEFIDHEGVRFRPEGLDVLNGHEGLVKFFDDVYEYLRLHGGMIKTSGVDEELFTEHLRQHSRIHVGRMTELALQRKDIRAQAIIREGDFNFQCSAYADYRWFPKQYFSPVPFYVYGDTVAIMTFRSSPPPKIIRIHSAVIAEAYRLQFDDMWQRSKIPPVIK